MAPPAGDMAEPLLASQGRMDLMNHNPGDECLGAPCWPWNWFGAPGLSNKLNMRIEPKVFFANERTFLSWLHMAVTLGGIGSAILGVASSSQAGKDPKDTGAAVLIMGFKTVQLVGLILLPVSVVFVIYAVYTFQWRANKIRKREDYNYDDRFGPLVLGSVMSLALAIIFGLALADVVQRVNKH